MQKMQKSFLPHPLPNLHMGYNYFSSSLFSRRVPKSPHKQPKHFFLPPPFCPAQNCHSLLLRDSGGAAALLEERNSYDVSRGPFALVRLSGTASENEDTSPQNCVLTT